MYVVGTVMVIYRLCGEQFPGERRVIVNDFVIKYNLR